MLLALLCLAAACGGGSGSGSDQTVMQVGRAFTSGYVASEVGLVRGPIDRLDAPPTRVGKLSVPAGTYLVTGTIELEHRAGNHKRLVRCGVNLPSDGRGPSFGLSLDLPFETVTIHRIVTLAKDGEVAMECVTIDGPSDHSDVFITAHQVTALPVTDYYTSGYLGPEAEPLFGQELAPQSGTSRIGEFSTPAGTYLVVSTVHFYNNNLRPHEFNDRSVQCGFNTDFPQSQSVPHTTDRMLSNQSDTVTISGIVTLDQEGPIFLNCWVSGTAPGATRSYIYAVGKQVSAIPVTVHTSGFDGADQTVRPADPDGLGDPFRVASLDLPAGDFLVMSTANLLNNADQLLQNNGREARCGINLPDDRPGEEFHQTLHGYYYSKSLTLSSVVTLVEDGQVGLDCLVLNGPQDHSDLLTQGAELVAVEV